MVFLGFEKLFLIFKLISFFIIILSFLLLVGGVKNNEFFSLDVSQIVLFLKDHPNSQIDFVSKFCFEKGQQVTNIIKSKINVKTQINKKNYDFLNTNEKQAVKPIYIDDIRDENNFVSNTNVLTDQSNLIFTRSMSQEEQNLSTTLLKVNLTQPDALNNEASLQLKGFFLFYFLKKFYFCFVRH